VRIIVIYAILICTQFSSWALAENRTSVYFSNDSVNGLMISDAYETHNMGLIIALEDFFVSLDLGIVSPDMHVYKNEYRVANRAFGELVTLSLGYNGSKKDNLQHDFYIQLKSSGAFGIDKMQDLMHRLLNLQPVNYVNDLVRMPDSTWVGVGGKFQHSVRDPITYMDTFGVNYYFGSDRVEMSPFIDNSYSYKDILVTTEMGLRAVFFDEIVSAPPVSAKHRDFVPYAELAVSFDYFGLEWFIKDQFSLPRIKSDNDIFGVLSAGLTYHFD
jgi:hypothetical protein